MDLPTRHWGSAITTFSGICHTSSHPGFDLMTTMFLYRNLLALSIRQGGYYRPLHPIKLIPSDNRCMDLTEKFSSSCSLFSHWKDKDDSEMHCVCNMVGSQTTSPQTCSFNNSLSITPWSATWVASQLFIIMRFMTSPPHFSLTHNIATEPPLQLLSRRNVTACSLCKHWWCCPPRHTCKRALKHVTHTMHFPM